MNKYYFILLLSSLNWIFFNFQGFLYIKVFSALLLSIIHVDKIKNYYKNLRTMMDFNTNIKNMDIIDDEIIKETEDIEYINNKLIWCEKKYDQILEFTINQKIKIKNYINHNNYKLYIDQSVIWISFLKYYFYLVAEQINLNFEFFLSELCKYEWIDNSVKKVKKYKKLYLKMNKEEREEKTTKLEDITKIMSGLNNMMNFMTSLPKINNDQEDCNNSGILSSIKNKIPFKIPDVITEKIPLKIINNNQSNDQNYKKKKKNKKSK